MHGLLRMIKWCVSCADVLAEFAKGLVARQSQMMHPDLRAVPANSFTASSFRRLSE
jgi:hypothetical protein